MNIEVGLTKCFFCGKSKDIIMNTRLTKAAADEIKKINGKVIDTEPCNECRELMKQGVMLLSCRDAELNKLEELIKREDEPAYYVPKMGEKYFYMDEEGDVFADTWTNKNTDIRKHAFGNCYKTYDKAYNASSVQKDLLRLQRLALTLNRGEKINWKNTEQIKYGLVYDYYMGCTRQERCYTIKDMNMCCLSDKYLDEATKLFGKDRLKEILTYQRY